MGRRGQRVNAEPKPVRLSEWFKQAPGRPVTRAQLLNVFAMLIERRIQVERIIRHESKLYMRFLIWLFPSLSQLPRHVQDDAAVQALNPEAGSDPLAEDEEQEALDDVRDDTPPEVAESGVLVRDRRSSR